jgi:hypothetical protein
VHKALTGSRTRQLGLNVGFQVLVFLFTQYTIENDKKNAESHREKPRQHQLVPPAVLGKDAPCILRGGIVGNKASAEQKDSEHYEDDADMKHAYTCDHLKREKGPKVQNSEQPVDRAESSPAHDAKTSKRAFYCYRYAAEKLVFDSYF